MYHLLIRLLLIFLTFSTLAGCGTIGGATRGLGDDLFRLFEFSADRVF